MLKHNCSEIKILFKSVENKEKFLQNRNKLEEDGFLLQITEERTKEIFLKGYKPEIEKLETEQINRQLEKNHENLVIHKIQMISKKNQKNKSMKIVINHNADI